MKKKFKFRFETVEMIRKKNENKALLALAEAQKQIQLEIKKKQRYQQDLIEGLSRRENLGQVPTEISEFHLEESFIVGIKQKIYQTEFAIFKARKNLEKTLRSYLHAQRQLKVIEKIKTKDHQDYVKRNEKEERKALSDLYVMRASKKSEGVLDIED